VSVKWKKSNRAAVSSAVRPPVDSTGRPSRFGVFYRIMCAKDSFEVVPPPVEFMGVGIHDRHRCYIIPAG